MIHMQTQKNESTGKPNLKRGRANFLKSRRESWNTFLKEELPRLSFNAFMIEENKLVSAENIGDLEALQVQDIQFQGEVLA